MCRIGKSLSDNFQTVVFNYEGAFQILLPERMRHMTVKPPTVNIVPHWSSRNQPVWSTFNPAQPNSTQPNPTQSNPTQLNSTQPNPTQPNPTQPNPTQLKFCVFFIICELYTLECTHTTCYSMYPYGVGDPVRQERKPLK